jgi:phosphatidate cytidylyltransferase
VTRVLSGAVLGGIVLAIVWYAPPIASLALSIVALVLAAKEITDLARASGINVSLWLSGAAALTTLVALGAPAFDSGAGSALLPIVLMAQLVAVLAAAIAAWPPGSRDALATVSVALFPSWYVAVPLGALVAIRAVEGATSLLLLILTVVASDTAQYYTGRLTGRHLLAPAISPKKTIEGAIGGVVFGTLVFALVGGWWLGRVPAALRVIVGVAIVLAGIAGDLFESMLKRSAGVKDSSSLIPGHGGVLDRIDALLFAAPVYYIVLRYV